MDGVIPTLRGEEGAITLMGVMIPRAGPQSHPRSGADAGAIRC